MADGTKATKRNPIMMLVLVIGISIGANIVGGIVAGILSSGMVAQLFSLVGYVGALFIVMGMVAELK